MIHQILGFNSYKIVESKVLFSMIIPLCKDNYPLILGQPKKSDNLNSNSIISSLAFYPV